MPILSNSSKGGVKLPQVRCLLYLSVANRSEFGHQDGSDTLPVPAVWPFLVLLSVGFATWP
jgi:hypothetical protein